MLKFYKTVNSKIEAIDQIEDGCWINITNPTSDELNYIIQELNIDPSFLNAALDEEESARVETEDDQTLVIVDVPITEQQTENTIMYLTMPMGIIICGKHIITVAITEHAVLTEMLDGTVKNVQTALKTRFLFMLLLRIVSRFLQYLRQINKIQDLMERQLQRSMKNKELIQMLGIEKSLVYFSTALKANEIVIEKILRGRVLKLYDEDQDILEDVLVENKQAIDMTNTYSVILSSTMDIFASIISNNLNIVMKKLTSITLLMAIPTMVSSFYGMNVGLPFANFGFAAALSITLTSIAYFVLWKMDMLK